MGLLILFLASVAALTIGSIHYGHAWPGTGGHRPADGDLIPGAIARVCWAATLWITSYWAHPHALAKFPVSEVVWMFVAPALLVAAVGSARGVARRLEISSRSLRFESWVAVAAGVAMIVFLAGTAAWLAAGASTSLAMFRTGAIDACGAALMAAALIVACRAVRRVLSAPAGPAAAGSDA